MRYQAPAGLRRRIESALPPVRASASKLRTLLDGFAMGSVVSRSIAVKDVRHALVRGLDDFLAMPTPVIFLSLIYPVVGIVLANFSFGEGLLSLLFPLTAGFALVGPFATVGLCELSRRRELKRELGWWHAFDVIRSPSFGSITALAILLTLILLLWLEVAQAIYVANFGSLGASSITQFGRQIFTTRQGWALIIEGNAVGFLFATAVLTISFVSFPLLLDRKATAATAVLASIRVVFRNPSPAMAWGFVIAAALAIGSLPLFVRLAIVMPVLGHTSWHVYRRAVEG
jgi:uncharacterized membrane protein